MITQTTKTQNMAGTKLQTSKFWKCPIFPDLARSSSTLGSREADEWYTRELTTHKHDFSRLRLTFFLSLESRERDEWHACEPTTHEYDFSLYVSRSFFPMSLEKEMSDTSRTHNLRTRLLTVRLEKEMSDTSRTHSPPIRDTHTCRPSFFFSYSRIQARACTSGERDEWCLRTRPTNTCVKSACVLCPSRECMPRERDMSETLANSANEQMSEINI